LNVSYSRYVLFWGLFGIIIAIWLASSQPEPEPVAPEDVEPPDLLDFAVDEGEMIIGVKNGDASGNPHSVDEPRTPFGWGAEPPEPEGSEPGDEASSPQGEDDPPQE
jgi:hypothetical protein